MAMEEMEAPPSALSAEESLLGKIEEASNDDGNEGVVGIVEASGAEQEETADAATASGAMAGVGASQTQADEEDTPDEAARRKKTAKNKAKRDRQKAKAKAALQQVRAAEAAGVSVGKEPAAESHAEMQAKMQAQIQAEMQAQMAQMQAQLQAQLEARMQGQALPQNAPSYGATVDTAAPGIADRSSATGVTQMLEQTASTGSRTEQLMRRVEMLAQRQAENRSELATKHQLGQQPQQLQQPQKPPEKRLQDMEGEELAQELHKRAAIFATSDRWEDANTAWGQATDVTPDNAEMWYYRGIASQKLERSLDAEKYWKRAVKLGHTQSADLLSGVRLKRAQEAKAKADALLSADKFDKAIGMYTAAMNICPDNSDHCAACHHGRATGLGLSARWEDAKVAWASASALAPTNPTFFHYQGLASLKLEQFDEAENFLAKAVDMGYERSIEQLETAQRLKRERAAVIVYQRAMTLWDDVEKPSATDSASSGSAGKSNVKNAAKSRTTKLCKAALAEFREADRAGYHNKPGIHIMSALCLTKLQRWAEAVQEIKKALASIPAEDSEGEDGAAKQEWAFQGLTRTRLVAMAVNLEKMHQAEQKSEVQKLLQAAGRTS